MELYALDPLFRRQFVIDEYVSLIWTERFNTHGEFQLRIISTPATRRLFTPDTYLAMNQSNYIMRVEQVEDDATVDGARTLLIKGRSYESILLDRVARDNNVDLTTEPTWNITLAPAALMRKLFHDICVTGVGNVKDIIPGIVESSLISSNIPEPTDPIVVQLKPDTLYAGMSGIGQVWNLGFRFLRQEPGTMYFDVYSGSDRTASQTILTPVIFSSNLDNLQNTKELTTINQSKNVAYVYSTDGFEEVYAPGVDTSTSGLQRRVLVVDASDITTAAGYADVPSALIQRGKDKLSQATVFKGFDGEISQNCPYIYGQHYNLGDLVELQNIDGVAESKRVTEQIFVSDATGTKSYPTLVANTFINTGSWLSWTSSKTWFDFDLDTTSTWATQP